MLPKISKKYRQSVFLATTTLLITLISVIFFRSALIFILLLAFNALLNLYQRSTGLPFDMTPTTPLVIIFSIQFGFWPGFIFLFFSSIVPGIFVGGFNPNIILIGFLGLVIGYLASVGIVEGVITYGLILVIFEGIVWFFIATLVSSETLPPLFVFLASTLNIIYLIIFQNFLTYIMFL
ncbi:MAG: hypothetical protein GF368_05755 [Candidatus Aenigmarchaeota archaeon]|nr:hypothetical protein [Candidatus Aenigmarchaeota archaeon]